MFRVERGGKGEVKKNPTVCPRSPDPFYIVRHYKKNGSGLLGQAVLPENWLETPGYSRSSSNGSRSDFRGRKSRSIFTQRNIKS